jgi:hypothetical protein
MSNAYVIKGPDLMIEAWAGAITLEEFLEHERRHLQDPKFPISAKILVDITRASFDLSIGESEIQSFVDLYRHHRDKVAGARIAIVAGKDFGRASLYGRMAEKHMINVIVFNSLQSACVWLGIDTKEIRQELDRILAGLSTTSPDAP